MRPLPENVPKCGQKANTGNVRSTILTHRPAAVRQCVDFSATYIDDALASALLFRSSTPQVGDSVVQIIACAKNQEVANHERDTSKTDKL